MEIDQRSEGPVTIATLNGEFDAFNHGTVTEHIDGIIDGGGKRLVLNLKDLKFINSSALGFLIKTSKRLKELDGELAMSEPSNFFQTTIKTLGIDKLFKVFDSDSDAVAYFSDAGGAKTADFEGVPVSEELLGSTEIHFRLLTDPDREAVGKILALWEDGPTLKYPADPSKVKVDPDDLMVGTGLWIKFRQPFLDKERFFEMEAEIVMAMDLDDDAEGAAKFRLRYTKIDDADREVLDKFVKDQDDFRAI